MSAIDLKNFINREKEIALIMNRASDLEKGKPFAPKERVFHFVGPSGIGKSSLLQKICSRLAEQPSTVPILVSLDTLKGTKQEFTYGLLISVYEEFCKFSQVVANPVLKKPSMTIHRSASMIQRAISLRDVLTVLLLDEINVPSSKDMREVEEYLLAKFIHDSNRAILITAGRSHPAMFNDFALRPNPSNTFLLSAFDEEKTGIQMEFLKPGSGVLAGKVVKLGSGVPGNTVKLAEHLSGNPLDIQNEMHAIQSLLDDIKKEIKENYYPMLEAISILQGFSRKMLPHCLRVIHNSARGGMRTRSRKHFWN